MEERYTLTRAGYEEMQRELTELEARYQRELAELADVQDGLDPEAAEPAYFESKTTKEEVEERLGHLRLVLRYADVIDEDPDPTVIDPGDRVVVYDYATKETLTFDILGSEEVIHGREGVSMDSPVGQALLGKRVGDVIQVEVPDGRVRYAIRSFAPIPR